MRIVLMRHGQAEGNAEGRYIGRKSNPPLTAKGVRQLRQIVSSSNEKLVYTSSLRRAVETAEILFPLSKIKMLPQLDEMDFGDFEGKNYIELTQNKYYQRWIDSDCTTNCPNAESIVDFKQRVNSCFEELVSKALEAEEESFTIVAHGGTVMAILERYAIPEKDFFCWRLANGEYYTADLSSEDWKEKQIVNWVKKILL